MFGKTKSWSAISASLKEPFNRGYLSNVAHGKRSPSRKLLKALKIPVKPRPCSRISDMSTKKLARLLKERG